MNPSAPVLTCLECWLLLWGSTRIVGAMGSTQDPLDQPSSSSLSNGCVGFEYHIYTSSTSWSRPYPFLFDFFLFFFSFCPLFSSALSSTRIFCHFFFSFQLLILTTFRLLPLPLHFPLTTKSISRSLEFWVCLFCGRPCYFSCRRWSSWGQCILRRKSTHSRSVQAAALVLSLWCCVSILRWQSN